MPTSHPWGGVWVSPSNGGDHAMKDKPRTFLSVHHVMEKAKGGRKEAAEESWSYKNRGMTPPGNCHTWRRDPWGSARVGMCRGAGDSHPPRSRRHVWQYGLRPTAHGRCFATVRMGPTGGGPTVEPTAPCRVVGTAGHLSPNLARNMACHAHRRTVCPNPGHQVEHPSQ